MCVNVLDLHQYDIAKDTFMQYMHEYIYVFSGRHVWTHTYTQSSPLVTHVGPEAVLQRAAAVSGKLRAQDLATQAEQK